MNYLRTICFQLPEDSKTSELYKQQTGNENTQTCISFNQNAKDFSFKGPHLLYGQISGSISRFRKYDTFSDYENNDGWKKFLKVETDKKNKKINFDIPYVMGGEAEFSVDISMASSSEQKELFDFFDNIGSKPFEKDEFC